MGQLEPEDCFVYIYSEKELWRPLLENPTRSLNGKEEFQTNVFSPLPPKKERGGLIQVQLGMQTQCIPSID